MVMLKYCVLGCKQNATLNRQLCMLHFRGRIFQRMQLKGLVWSLFFNAYNNFSWIFVIHETRNLISILLLYYNSSHMLWESVLINGMYLIMLGTIKRDSILH